MTPHTTEEPYDELLRLLEEEKGWSERTGTLSEGDMEQYRQCLRRIEELVLGLAKNGRERP